VHFKARLRPGPNGYRATCEDVDVTGDGGTREVALEALRKALLDRFGHVEGVALPSREAPIVIDFVAIDEGEPSRPTPSGPGDPA
jgi:hypothetical protein